MSKTINKITALWEPIGEMPKVYENETYKMLKMQKLAYEALKNKSNVIINAPTAAGKTLAICWMNAKRLTDNTKLKAIISVPQTIIADGFRGAFNLSFEDGSVISWCPRHFLCSNNIPDTNIELIERFLNREGQINDINDRILVCSHASLVDAFQKHPQLFKNLIIVIDEAHHISYSEGEEVEDGDGRGAMVFCNQMGAIVATALKDESKNISLMLSTATLFRGDRLEIIPDKYVDRFETFHYPMDEYLKDCHWLRSFSYDFAMYNGSYIKRMTELFSERIGKTIVYIPHVASKRYSSGSKAKDWDNVYKAIAGKNRYEIQELDNGMTLIKNGNKWIKVVNLADDSDMTLRDKRKNLIIEAHKSGRDSLDVIVALNMFKEGANWKWADREIIVGTKGSLTDMNQIVGRLFRDAKDKKHIQTVQLLPFSFDQIDKEVFRGNLNEYMKVIFATMLLDEAIKPLKISIPLKSANAGNGTGNGGAFVDYLRKVVKDENKIHSIQKEIMIKAVTAQDNGEIDFGCNNVKSRDKFEKIVSEVLNNREIKLYHKEIAQQIHKSWIRESLKTIKGIDLSHVDFETIQINPLAFMLTYTSGMCGVKTFRAFREAIREYSFLPFNEARSFVRKLGLNSLKEWQRYSASNKRPKNIPNNPARVYDEFVGFGDWLGNGNISNRDKKFRSFEEARNFVRSKNFKSNMEWRKWANSADRPSDIPWSPDSQYKVDGWIDWSDFIGYRTRTYKKDCMSKENMIKFMKDKGINKRKKWVNYLERNGIPNNLPSNIEVVYGIKWSEISGNPSNFDKSKSFDFDESLNFYRSWAKNFKKENKKYPSKSDWNKWCNRNERPVYVPRNPDQVWKDIKDNSFGYLFGTGYIAPRKRKYRTFDKAREYVRSLGFKNEKQWYEYAKTNHRPKDIPYAPRSSYKSKFISMSDWLGTGKNSKNNRWTFQESRSFVMKLGLKSEKCWREYCKSGKKPSTIPSHPACAYKHDWKGMGDWLGTGFVACQKRVYRPINEAQKFVCNLGLVNSKEYLEYAKSGNLPKDIPNDPRTVYKDEFKGFGWWLRNEIN